MLSFVWVFQAITDLNSFLWARMTRVRKTVNFVHEFKFVQKDQCKRPTLVTGLTNFGDRFDQLW